MENIVTVRESPSTAPAEYEMACRQLAEETPESVQRAKDAAGSERWREIVFACQRGDFEVADLLMLQDIIARWGIDRVRRWIGHD